MKLSTLAVPVLALAALLATTLTASAQDWAKARLDNSPRHLEFIELKHDNRVVQSFLAFPEIKEKATAVVVIHEIFGLSDWVRGVTDQLAEAGYIAIAPDLLWGLAPKGGGSAELGGPDEARKYIPKLSPEQVTADLNAAVEYASKLPACNGKVIVMGFCWGGGQSFRLATNNKSVKAALVFYGTGPTDAAEIAKIQAPVYGFYAGNDARVDATVPPSVELMKAGGKTFEPVTYDGAGHGFMRAGEAPPPGSDANEKARTDYEANKKARTEAWKRVLEILKKA